MIIFTSKMATSIESHGKHRYHQRLEPKIRGVYPEVTKKHSREELITKIAEIRQVADNLEVKKIGVLNQFIYFCIGVVENLHQDETFLGYMRSSKESPEDSFLNYRDVFRFKLKQMQKEYK